MPLPPPILDLDGVTLYQGDVMELLPQFPEPLGADLVLADPPTGETKFEWDKWPVGWPSMVYEHSKRQASLWCFGSLRTFLSRAYDFELDDDNNDLWQLAQDVIWEKHNGSGFHNDRFRRVHEQAAQFYKIGTRWRDVYREIQHTPDALPKTVRRKGKPPGWHGATAPHTYTSQDGGPRLMRSVIQARSMHGHALNETQKPLEILRPLIQYSCPRGALVLVPFAGSGSELEACRELGRRAIGFEIRPQQCQRAIARLSQGLLLPCKPKEQS